MHYYAFNIGDYNKKTHYLTDDEDLAYRRLLDLYYDTENPLEADPERISRRIRMSGKIEAVESVLKDYFELREDGRWHEDRCDRTIASYKAMAEGGRQGAEKRWAKNKQNQLDNSPPIPTLSKPHSYPNANQEPETNNYKLKTTATRQNGVKADEICREEVLPSSWQNYAEGKSIPDQQIFISWRKFKEVSSHPWRLSNWHKWVDRERVK